ncbi:hypothetical protein N7474_007702 [Penicillium riverlandense]|uniref:uncharacterized protein n=1 Tax=Penicillium riverlandense TaxID=1903569 RepID=UPI0025497C05|nr:uncharacterized protein N7474_007702 [Penicillium riverlandense]KAJ5811401.1 hypothetical protein N7474_007702 [Penicillium riverlandense]
MSTSIDQRKFLAEAAESLSLSSPSTAAYLLARHTQILHEESKSLTSRQREHYCGACGSIRQAQWTKKAEIKPKKTAVVSGGATVYQCLRCHRRTVNPHKKAAPTRAMPRAVAATASPGLPVTTAVGVSSSQTSQATSDSADTQATKAADNVNSKKRAKARKQGGLQALLASKQRPQTSSSLDLLDFLNQA